MESSTDSVVDSIGVSRWRVRSALVGSAPTWPRSNYRV